MKKNKMNLLIFLFSFLIFGLYAQDNTLIEINPLGIAKEFGKPLKYYRTNINCNCYKEKALWSDDTLIFCNFFESWFVKQNNEWSVFYDANNSSKQSIKINDIDCFIDWDNDTIINDKVVKPFGFIGKRINVNFETLYFFDLKEGLVGYTFDGLYYIRSY